MKGYLFLTDKNGKRIHLDRNGLRIGRKKDNQLIISKESVSNHHAQLIWMENRMYLVDNKSKGGVYVNGRKVRGRVALRPGDMITIGGENFRFNFKKRNKKKKSEESKTGLAMLVGAIICIGGILVSVFSYSIAEVGDEYIITWSAIIIGAAIFIGGALEFIGK